MGTATIQHKDGKVGGYLVGRRHSQGGIKARNVSNSEPLEVEADEVIITRQAVLSKKKKEYNGKIMTNLEILSAINKEGGGVSLLEQGGKTGSARYSIRCCGKKHSYNGEELTDREILQKMEEGGKVPENISPDHPESFAKAYLNKMDHSDKRSSHKIEAIEQRLNEAGILYTWHQAKSGTIYLTTIAGQVRISDHASNSFARNRLDAKYEVGNVSDLEHIIPKLLHEQEKKTERLRQIHEGSIIINRNYPSSTKFQVIKVKRLVELWDVRIKNLSNEEEFDILLLKPWEVATFDKMEQGGTTCGCQHPERMPLPHHLLPSHYPDQYKDGGKIPVRTRKEKPGVPEGGYYKGMDYAYHNPYELNRAIEALLDSRPEGDFDAAEKRFLKYYSGYGGLEKYGAEGVGLLYEYYTPAEIARRMWGLAYKYGYQGGAILEPSCGTGEFFNYAPDSAQKTGYEINDYSARITRILHPTVKVETLHFEELFLKNRDTIRNRVDGLPKYDLVIGNPPYGNFQGKFAGMGEKAYTRASNYIDYFIFRGLDLLVPGGLLIYIIGAEVAAGGVPFLAQKAGPVKQEIAEKAELLDAYRLPNGVFDRTDVLTDIIVLKKL